MYKHYGKKDINKNIIDVFSSWQFEKFDGTEFFIKNSNERNFFLILNDGLIYLNKWKGNKIKEKTKEEQDKERELLPVNKTGLQNLIDVLIDKNIILPSDL